MIRLNSREVAFSVVEGQKDFDSSVCVTLRVEISNLNPALAQSLGIELEKKFRETINRVVQTHGGEV